MKAPTYVRRGKNNRKWSSPDREWLEHQYMTLAKSGPDIAQEIGCAQGTVYSWLQNLHIPIGTKIRNYKTKGRDLPYGTSPTQKSNRIKSGIPMFCAWCGTTKKIEIHHKNHNREDGRPKNLMWLCRHCNLLESRIWQLIKLGRIKVTSKNRSILIDFKVDE